ncbi:MAG: tetratricopeptide repeat protein [Deltaproteobacteria bacterium]|nr:tetratricopeptide repeat protein [Deltaproteobacteria bacterium]
MSFVRRKRGQVLLVHNERVPSSARVRQRELHCFTSPLELERVLAPAEWTRWTRAISWRERDLEFDWPSIRERLHTELASWTTKPAGATRRRDHRVERLASELASGLAPLSLALPSDAALIERVRPSLLALRDSIARLLAPERPAPPPEPRECTMSPPTTGSFEAADAVFDDGMEFWWNGDRRSALRHFKRALELDPRHADAHNHLGISSLSARRLKDAERRFRAAVDGGERHVERDGALVPWGILENRPYLRALANLALVLSEQRRWPEALAIHQRILELNPGDHQGVRYLVGVEHLQVGDNQGALRAFEECFGEEVGCAFGLALARLRSHGPSAEVGEPLLTGFAANRYVAPMLLGERWERLDAFHGSNMAEPEWASDVLKAQAELWHAIPRGADVLRFWWGAPAVATWRRRLDDAMISLKALPLSDKRNAVAAEASSLRSEQAIRGLVRSVLSAS